MKTSDCNEFKIALGTVLILYSASVPIIF